MYKIAVVDDDGAWNAAVKRFFSRHGYDVHTFTDPRLFLTEATKFDIALIDFYLSSSRATISDLNGYALIRQLKQHCEKCPILVLVSAFVDMESARLFPDADFFLVKDIGLDVILQRTQELLEYRTATVPSLA